jgi:THO complex subunit 1
VPSTDSYVKGIANIELDLDFATSEEEKQGLQEAKASKTWRALRIASRTRLGRFDKVDDGKNLDVLFDPDTAMEEAASSSAKDDTAGASTEAPEGQGVDSVAELDGHELGKGLEELRPGGESQVTAAEDAG